MSDVNKQLNDALGYVFKKIELVAVQEFADWMLRTQNINLNEYVKQYKEVYEDVKRCD